jgi:hypothetical protein
MREDARTEDGFVTTRSMGMPWLSSGSLKDGYSTESEAGRDSGSGEEECAVIRHHEMPPFANMNNT